MTNKESDQTEDKQGIDQPFDRSLVDDLSVDHSSWSAPCWSISWLITHCVDQFPADHPFLINFGWISLCWLLLLITSSIDHPPVDPSTCWSLHLLITLPVDHSPADFRQDLTHMVNCLFTHMVNRPYGELPYGELPHVVNCFLVNCLMVNWRLVNCLMVNCTRPP